MGHLTSGERFSKWILLRYDLCPLHTLMAFIQVQSIRHFLEMNFGKAKHVCMTSCHDSFIMSDALFVNDPLGTNQVQKFLMPKG